MGMTLDELKDEDKIFEFKTIKVVVNENELENIGEIEIDYRESRWGNGFVVRSSLGSTCS